MSFTRQLDELAQWLFKQLENYSFAKPAFRTMMLKEIHGQLQNLNDQSRQDLSDKLNTHGYTALQYAIRYCDPPMVEMLSVNELWYDEDDIRRSNPVNGQNLLHSAVLSKNKILFQMVWEKLGKDTTLLAQKDKHNKTPYDYALDYGAQKTAALLKPNFFKPAKTQQKMAAETKPQAGKFAEMHAFLNSLINQRSMRTDEKFLHDIEKDFVDCLNKIANQNTLFSQITIQFPCSLPQLMAFATYSSLRVELEMSYPTVADLKQYIEFLNSSPDGFFKKLTAQSKQEILSFLSLNVAARAVF